MPTDDQVIRNRLVRNRSDGPLDLAPARDVIPDKAREIDVRLPFMPGLPSLAGLGDTEQLTNAHSGALETAKRIRAAADRAWNDEPSIQGIDNLTPAQRLAWKREHVRNVVQGELEKSAKLLKPTTERGRKELGERRAKLVEKGTPRFTGIEAERALRLADHFARLEPEIRAARIIDALNNASDSAERELVSCVAWSNPHLDLVSPETRERCLAMLIATSNAPEYDALTTFDRALTATEESIANLESWSATLSNEP